MIISANDFLTTRGARGFVLKKLGVQLDSDRLAATDEIELVVGNNVEFWGTVEEYLTEEVLRGCERDAKRHQ